ncbi:hypothetical protein HGO21_00340 [Acinetobacter sp. CUI P1]|jgi:hypothetical protein|nr:hypothetical protein [Acinetobacter sp. CUI P1]
MLGNGKTYESMLNDLGNSKETWLELLKYNNIHPIWLQKLDFLLQNEADLREWNSFWSGNIDTIPADICDFRQQKIQYVQSKISFSEFESLYCNSKKLALEALFIEAVPAWMVECLEASGITGEWIYHARINDTVEHVWNLISGEITRKTA